jgi:nucleotide-binding universal stress UspA family protein
VPNALRTVSAGFNRALEGHAALRTAAALASELGAGLRAIVVDEGVVHARHSLDHRVDREDPLEEQLDRALADANAPGAERIVLEGGAATCLAEACSDSDLLVVGSRSYGPLHHTLLGSVSAKLMRSCPAPLLVVPRGIEVPALGTASGPGELSQTRP